MLRRAKFADLDRLLEIEEQSAPKSAYDLLELEALLYRYADTFLVTEGCEVEGYIVFSHEGHIVSMAVAPEYRRRGVGSRLLEEVEHRCAGRILHLEVRASNSIAIRFYEQCGFEAVGRRKAYYHDGEDAFIMLKAPAGERKKGNQAW
ncbi:MAG: ribosomal protein S18-alanine N-acetyltransferase [Deltaproteobacteria bacterium]|nr:ribosomal protein S18-alanine N-acetyltransferase [Deltaproteobacteria bacterium]MBW2072172.1 ribosomal protein S18-alanine N-acetyltransferase [Deltaproteobacteria bacterium]